MFEFDKKTLRVAAIIAAGGSSRRMGFDKLTAEICGETVIAKTVRAFEVSEIIDEIVIVCPNDRIKLFESLVKRNDFTKLKAIVAGGETRQKSVSNGANAVSSDIDILCIHDGARPLVSQRVIADSVAACAEFGAATAAVKVKDTIKQAENSIIEKTIPRDSLYQIQTPQVFSRELYLKAYHNAKEDYSDDCQLLESIGQRVAISEGDYKNIKLTTAEDMIIAKAFLECEEA
ncbi:MAG: 2-C-methyl-D-erythritol 4-phosphate cytidylyltransferase [Oscillospiraceae bacterium]|nr:2-C-methyl-D-erythritol 4-phosphate cytidylyltransferase [Oscillospiraceae bacterium]